MPIELSWKLGNSGFFAKAGLGMYVPDGSISGPTGLSGLGRPWWTFEPEFIISYLKDGWNFTSNTSLEILTKNTFTDYRSGDVLHAEFTATKTIGNWTMGPVALYYGQITDDKSSSFYNYAVGSQRYNIWAAGALVGYNFGPASLNVWALNDFSANTRGGTASSPGVDTASTGKFWQVFAQINFRLWSPDETPPPKIPVFRK